MNRLNDLYFGGLVGGLTVIAITIPIVGAGGAVGFVQTVNTLGVVAIAASAYFAYGLLKTTEARNIADEYRTQSAAILAEAITTLERSYEMFTSRSSAARVPLSDRLLWLSVARMLSRFYELKERITEPDHQIIVVEQEQYWRHEFYVVLDESREAMTEQYFRQGGPNHGGAPIEPRSMLTIYNFSRWPENYVDPIDRINADDLIQAGVIPINHFGARRYLGTL